MRSGIGLELGFGAEAEKSCHDIAGEASQRHVVVFHHFRVAASFGGYAVLRAFELCLKVFEVFVGLEVGVCFAHGVDVEAERAVEAALCGVVAVECLCVAGGYGVLQAVGGIVCIAEVSRSPGCCFRVRRSL